MNKNQIAKLVRAYTSGSMNLEDLRGAQMKYARDEIMKNLGYLKGASINFLYSALYAFYDIDGTCAAHMQLKLIEAMREAMVDKEVEKC